MEPVGLPAASQFLMLFIEGYALESLVCSARPSHAGFQDALLSRLERRSRAGPEEYDRLSIGT